MRSIILNHLFRILRPTVLSAIVGLAVLSATLLFVGQATAASPGALDLSFGLRGTSAFTMGTFSEESRAIALQPDGKVVLAGFACIGSPCNNHFVVSRFNTNGTLDSGFGTNGIVVTDFSGEHEWAQAVAIQADGKIVVAGGTVRTTSPAGFKIVRYMPDGTLDSTFGTGGKVFENFDNAGGTAFSVFIQPDGKIVAAGTDDISTLFVVRLNSNGGLDTGFGTGGKISTNAYNVAQVRMPPQSDGKIIIAGAAQSTGTLKLIRLNTNGTPDSDFGVGGVATASAFAPDAFVPTVAIQAGGKILVSGAVSPSLISNPPLGRFNQDGSVDGSLVPNHGEMNGPVNGFCLSCTQRVAKILPLADGRFYLAGQSRRAGTSRVTFAVTRYWGTGLVDYSYGFRGVSYFRYTNTGPHGTNVPRQVDDAVLQADGKIVLGATGNLPFNNNQQLHSMAIRLEATVTPPSLRGDFDGDGKTDLSVFRPSNSVWYVLRSSDGGVNATSFGVGQDLIVPGDYNQDRKTDYAIFRVTQSGWFLGPSLPTGGGNPGGNFGQNGDIPVQEDYDGDGKTDLATYRPSNGTWNIRYSSRILDPDFPVYDISFGFGVSTDKPVPADYDGDGRADLAVYRPSEGRWYILRTSDGLVTNVHFGLSTDKTVQADYDGDLKTDIAVFRDGAWYILRSSDGGFVGVNWGVASDKPVPGDYDGDGKYDVAVYRPSEGVWYVLRSSDSVVTYGYWGISEDIPILNTFVR
jgi:uncharacterized delta-60 repeat protein